MYLYYLDGAQDDSSEEEWPVIGEDDQESDVADLDDMSLEKRGDMWKFRSGKRGDLWKFRGGKRGNQWKFRGGKRGETLWKFRGGKRADLWKFRGGKRALTNGRMLFHQKIYICLRLHIKQKMILTINSFYNHL